MPLMSEGKAGPSRTKMRAIWRATKRRRDAEVAYLEARRAAGRPVSEMSLETLAIGEAWLSGRSTPVGLIPAAWRAVCAELNAEAEPAAPADRLF